MRKCKILTVVGTRPNFIKVTQFNRCLNRPEWGLEHKIVHTGQHYDDKMSRIFFQQFELEPDFWLNIPSVSVNSQTAHIMMGLEKVIKESFQADFMLVVGDVNSTLAAALSAYKLGIPFAHVESGLRSSDRTMPEEINRILTDEIADYFFVTEQSGLDHLAADGKKDEQVFFVGNTMIDTLVAFEKQIQASDVLEKYQIQSGEFVLMTMHRPATVDHQAGLEDLLAVIDSITEKNDLVFPIHPRTMSRFEKFGLADKLKKTKRLILAEPLDYFSFQKLIADCKYVITDSGGIQEETTFRQRPCLTLRPNTERPITTTLGTNTLVPFDLEVLQPLIQQIEAGTYKKGEIPPYWDGKASERIAEVIYQQIVSRHDLSYSG